MWGKGNVVIGPGHGGEGRVKRGRSDSPADSFSIDAQASLMLSQSVCSRRSGPSYNISQISLYGPHVWPTVLGRLARLILSRGLVSRNPFTLPGIGTGASGYM